MYEVSLCDKSDVRDEFSRLRAKFRSQLSNMRQAMAINAC